ncbi:hypothetical protein HK405_005463 [Cladochytrium tenue]|nr:hypothetical protein HK405_005463 [Cladochytrium tenue]
MRKHRGKAPVVPADDEEDEGSIEDWQIPLSGRGGRRGGKAPRDEVRRASPPLPRPSPPTVVAAQRRGLQTAARARALPRTQRRRMDDEDNSDTRTIVPQLMTGVDWQPLLVDRLGLPDEIVFLVGAGISVAAGLPVFRGAGGLYSGRDGGKLKDLFDQGGYKRYPDEFDRTMEGLRQQSLGAQPTRFHRLMKQLSDLGVLRTCYTMNIDELEFKAGLRPERVLAVHGTLHSVRCSYAGCQNRGPTDDTDWSQFATGGPVWCKDCLATTTQRGREIRNQNRMRADIWLYGEQDDARAADFLDRAHTDSKTRSVKLLVVAGTSLCTPDSKSAVRDLANAVIRRGGFVAFVNPAELSRELKTLCTVHFRCEADEFAELLTTSWIPALKQHLNHSTRRAGGHADLAPDSQAGAPHTPLGHVADGPPLASLLGPDPAWLAALSSPWHAAGSSSREVDRSITGMSSGTAGVHQPAGERLHVPPAFLDPSTPLVDAVAVLTTTPAVATTPPGDAAAALASALAAFGRSPATALRMRHQPVPPVPATGAPTLAAATPADSTTAALAALTAIAPTLATLAAMVPTGAPAAAPSLLAMHSAPACSPAVTPTPAPATSTASALRTTGTAGLSDMNTTPTATRMSRHSTAQMPHLMSPVARPPPSLPALSHGAPSWAAEDGPANHYHIGDDDHEVGGESADGHHDSRDHPIHDEDADEAVSGDEDEVQADRCREQGSDDDDSGDDDDDDNNNRGEASDYNHGPRRHGRASHGREEARGRWPWLSHVATQTSSPAAAPVRRKGRYTSLAKFALNEQRRTSTRAVESVVEAMVSQQASNERSMVSQQKYHRHAITSNERVSIAAIAAVERIVASTREPAPNRAGPVAGGTVDPIFIQQAGALPSLSGLQEWHIPSALDGQQLPVDADLDRGTYPVPQAAASDNPAHDDRNSGVSASASGSVELVDSTRPWGPIGVLQNATGTSANMEPSVLATCPSIPPAVVLDEVNQPMEFEEIPVGNESRLDQMDSSASRGARRARPTDRRAQWMMTPATSAHTLSSPLRGPGPVNETDSTTPFYVQEGFLLNVQGPIPSPMYTSLTRGWTITHMRDAILGALSHISGEEDDTDRADPHPDFSGIDVADPVTDFGPYHEEDGDDELVGQGSIPNGGQGAQPILVPTEELQTLCAHLTGTAHPIAALGATRAPDPEARIRRTPLTNNASVAEALEGYQGPGLPDGVRLDYSSFRVNDLAGATTRVNVDVDSISITCERLDILSSNQASHIMPIPDLSAQLGPTGITQQVGNAELLLHRIPHLCVGSFGQCGRFRIYLFFPRIPLSWWRRRVNRCRLATVFYEGALLPVLRATMPDHAEEYPSDYAVGVQRARAGNGQLRFQRYYLPAGTSARFWDNIRAEVARTPALQRFAGGFFFQVLAKDLKAAVPVEQSDAGPLMITNVLAKRVDEIDWDAVEPSNVYVDIGLDLVANRGQTLVWRTAWAKQYLSELGFRDGCIVTYPFCLSGELGGATARYTPQPPRTREEEGNRVQPGHIVAASLYMHEKRLLYSHGRGGVLTFKPDHVAKGDEHAVRCMQTMVRTWNHAAEEERALGLRVEWRVSMSWCNGLGSELRGLWSRMDWPSPEGMFVLPTTDLMSWKAAVVRALIVLTEHVDSWTHRRDVIVACYIYLVAQSMVAPPYTAMCSTISRAFGAPMAMQHRNFFFANARWP